MNGYEPGRIVLSKAGRDKGRAFIIVGSEGPHLLLADGRLRRTEQPKKKKPMHVFSRPELITSIQGKLERGETPQNHEIRQALREAGYPACGKEQEEGEAWQRAI